MLTTGVIVAGDAPQPDASDDQPNVRSNAQLYGGRYAVEGELGHGGMSRVLRARDLKLERLVALKILKPGPHDRSQRLRFEQEARAAGALNHPNIVAVHDVGEHDGEPYIVTELLEGATLRTALGPGPLPPPHVEDLARQIAEGLAAAHHKGIVHRDLKPENLFLTSSGQVKILDFGIAKLLRPEKGPVHTDTGSVVGTPEYMSPEQVRGSRIDARSDVFSFGIVAHEMLQGRTPFVRNSSVETAYAILHDAAPPPASAPAQLSRVIARCLEKDPARRYADAGEIVEALGGARRPFELPARIPRRFRWPVALALLVVAGTLALARAIRKPAGFSSLVVLPFENLSGDPQQEYLADGMTGAIIDELARIRSLRVISRTSATAYKGARKPLRQIARELSVEAVVEGSVARSGDRIRVAARLIDASTEHTVWTDSYDRPMRDALGIQMELASAVAHEMRAALTPGESVRLKSVRVVDPEAYDLYVRAAYVERGHEYLESAIAKDPQFADAHARLAYVWANRALDVKVDPAIATAKTRSEARRALELDPENAEAHLALGTALIAECDNRAAVGELERAVELAPSNAFAWARLANAYAFVRRDDDSVSAARKALQADPVNADANQVLAWALHKAGRYEEMDAQTRRISDLDPKGPSAPLYTAWSAMERGQKERALAAALKLRALIDPGKDLLWDSLVAAALAFGGDRAEALALIEPWEARARTEFVDGHQLAVVRANLGDKDEAIAWLKYAREQKSWMHCPEIVAIDLERQVWLGALKGDPRMAQFLEPLQR